MEPLPDPEFKYIFDIVCSGRPAKTLEVGCNFGRELKGIEFLTQCYGVDKDVSKIQKAITYVPYGIFRVASGEDLPFPDNEFDLVYTDGCLCHNPQETVLKIINEMIRVSRGKVVIMEYLGTRVSANYLSFSNVKKGVWIHDYDTLLVGGINDIVTSKKIVVGLDQFSFMILSKNLPNFNQINELKRSIDVLQGDVYNILKLLAPKKLSRVERLKIWLGI